jgi:hypothetical protein
MAFTIAVLVLSCAAVVVALYCTAHQDEVNE